MNSVSRNDRVWFRSEVMGTQVITRDTGRRLGIVGEVIVDIDRREVVALGLRDNPLTRFLPGIPRWMRLDKIRQAGDVILVDSADSLQEDFNPEDYTKAINCQVITESGQELGRVLGFSFDIETGDLVSLIVSTFGVPLLGEGILSTWELTVDEIISSGADRIIVYEGAETKLKQLSSGLLEKLGFIGSVWEDERQNYKLNIVPVENQLASGEPINNEKQRVNKATADRFAPERELEYVEVKLQQREPTVQRRYLDEDEAYFQNEESEIFEQQESDQGYYKQGDYRWERNPESKLLSRKQVTKISSPIEEEENEQYDEIMNEFLRKQNTGVDDPW
ncbi:MAG TPA: PRC-barrel domain-containing protein [Prochlorococcaceae cyanobacterium AMR_MDS_5431]|nr:PRC-barrel domain-containing protein [Prochlorococcaceae cyanobacterium AMR_MDS_5431]